MTYEELIEIYPCIDLFLELFKGLAPTIVAVLAIIINNVAINSREKKSQAESRIKRINETRIIVLNQMLDRYMDLMHAFWVNGTNLILVLSSDDTSDNAEKMKCFENSLYQTQFKAQEILDYFKSTMELYEFSIGCDATLKDVNEFVNKLIDISEKYENLYKLKDLDKKNKLLDVATEEIKDAAIDVNAWTHVIIYNISKKIKELYEQ